MKSLLADLDITCTVAGIPSLDEIRGKRDILKYASHVVNFTLIISPFFRYNPHGIARL